MALINRVTRLFKADFNAVLDRIEEPEQLLRQAIRDMEDELAACRRRIAAVVQEQESLEARRREVRASAADFDGQLDLCFQSGKENLARGIVRRKLEGQRLLQRLEGRLESSARYLERQRRQLDENAATLDSLRQQAELVVDDDAAGGIPAAEDIGRGAPALRVSDDEVEVAFLREKTARSGS